MLAVSFDNGAGVEGGGGNVNGLNSVDNVTSENTKCLNKKVPNRRIIRKRGLWICVVIPVILGLILSFPGDAHAGRTKKDGGSKNGNFTQSPTNHKEAQNKQDTSSSSSSGGDDFWVGSHKLEFKPHPLLMPSTQSPMTSQIPIPIIELGQPTTSASLTSSSNEAGEVSDDLSEAASTTEAEEGEKGKGKLRKSRGGRKKSRDQRRMAHRTLWSRGIQNGVSPNLTATSGATYLMSALQQHQGGNPYFLHNHHQLQQQQRPVILTAGSMLSPQSPLLIPPLTSSRNDNSFHGSASTWNINHPGNQGGGGGGRIVGNQLQQQQAQASYMPQNSGSSSSSSSQESSQQVQGHYAAPLAGGGGGGGGMYTYPEFLQHHQQQISQQLGFPPQYAPQLQQSLQQPQIPLQFPPVMGSGGGGGQPYQMMPSGPEYTAQQSLSPVVVSSNNGPVMMYMAHGGGSGAGQVPSASGPIPVKPFNINEISSMGYPPHLQYNHLSSGPDYSQSSSPHHSEPHQHHQNSGGGGGSGGGSSSGKSTTNPQYFRNNFLRMFMDKLVNMGKVLPIPFVTKYATSPSTSPYPYQQQVQQYQGGYGRHGHFSRRMK